MTVRVSRILLAVGWLTCAAALSAHINPTQTKTARRHQADLNNKLRIATDLDVPNYKDERYDEVRRLLKQGADPNIASDGYTPLMHAVLWDHRRSAILLMRSGAKVSAVSKVGGTPLILASARRSSDPQIVRMLLQRGANPKYRDPEGHNALYYAEQSGNTEVVKVLRAWRGTRHGRYNSRRGSTEVVYRNLASRQESNDKGRLLARIALGKLRGSPVEADIRLQSLGTGRTDGEIVVAFASRAANGKQRQARFDVGYGLSNSTKAKAVRPSERGPSSLFVTTRAGRQSTYILGWDGRRVVPIYKNISGRVSVQIEKRRHRWRLREEWPCNQWDTEKLGIGTDTGHGTLVRRLRWTGRDFRPELKRW